MKHAKRFLLAVLVALVSAVSTYAYDFEATNSDGVTIYYEIMYGNACAVSNNGHDHYIGNVKIPSSVTYNGKMYPVIAIGERAFYGCSDLTSVEMPNSIEFIESYAFCWCTSLTSVEIPNSVIRVAEGAFCSCNGIESFIGKYASDDHRCLIDGGTLVAFAPAGLTSYSIPNNVTMIGEWAFANNDELTSVEIPNSVYSIGYGAFSDCYNLTSVNIQNSVDIIDMLAFGDCYGLTSVEIPNSVTTIGNLAFINCVSLTSVNIPNSVTTIGYYAFSACPLTSITIPESVTTIGDGAFSDCNPMTEIISLNTTPPTIGTCCFSDSALFYGVLRVPAESVDLYKAAEGWGDFTHIEPLLAVNVNGASASGALDDKSYDLRGNCVTNDHKGIVICKGKKTFVR